MTDDPRLNVQSGPFKGKPQQWFTRAEVKRLLANEQEAAHGRSVAHLAEQAELIDLDLLRQALVWYGYAPPVSQEALGWLVGHEVNHLLTAVIRAKDAAQGRRQEGRRPAA